jgi:hypothetical protein
MCAEKRKKKQYKKNRWKQVRNKTNKQLLYFDNIIL